MSDMDQITEQATEQGMEQVNRDMVSENSEVVELQSEISVQLTQEVEDAKAIESSVEDPELLKKIEQIPDKLAFKIGEAAEILGIRPYVLRYWESEFDELRPKKSNHNQRMYSRNDVKVAMMIKKLLYQDRFSIEGARKALRRVRSYVKNETEKKAVYTKIERSFDRLYAIADELAALKVLFQK
jgi:DNA-binding transcriptional MerR regulator